jgi:hypothetical protein
MTSVNTKSGSRELATPLFRRNNTVATALLGLLQAATCTGHELLDRGFRASIQRCASGADGYRKNPAVAAICDMTRQELFKIAEPT